tara:strand:- start:620 stop:3256 length:2637 start_codon:yes stop_codon:yes gene_type:complete
MELNMTSSFPQPSLDPLMKAGAREEELKQKTYVDSDAAWEAHTKESIKANEEYIKEIIRSTEKARTARAQTLKDFVTVAPKAAQTFAEIRENQDIQKGIRKDFEKSEWIDLPEDKLSEGQEKILQTIDGLNSNASMSAAAAGNYEDALQLANNSITRTEKNNIASLMSGQKFDDFLLIAGDIPIDAGFPDGLKRALNDDELSLAEKEQIYNYLASAWIAKIEQSNMFSPRFVRNNITKPIYLKKQEWLKTTSIELDGKFKKEALRLNASKLISDVSLGNDPTVLVNLIEGAEGEQKSSLGFFIQQLEREFSNEDTNLTIDNIFNVLDNSGAYTRDKEHSSLSEAYPELVIPFKKRIEEIEKNRGEAKLDSYKLLGNNFVLEWKEKLAEEYRTNNGVISDKTKQEFIRAYGEGKGNQWVFPQGTAQMITDLSSGRDDVAAEGYYRLLRARALNGFGISALEKQVRPGGLNSYYYDLFNKEFPYALNFTDYQFVRNKVKGAFSGTKGYADIDPTRSDLVEENAATEIINKYNRLKASDKTGASNQTLLQDAWESWETKWNAKDPDAKLNYIEDIAKYNRYGRTTKEGEDYSSDVQEFIPKLKKDSKLLLSDKELPGEDRVTKTNLDKYLKGESLIIPNVYRRYADVHNYDVQKVVLTRGIKLGLISEERAIAKMGNSDLYKGIFGQELYKELTKHPFANRAYELSNGCETIVLGGEAFVPDRVVKSGTRYDYIVAGEGITFDKPLSQMTVNEVSELVRDKSNGITEISIYGMSPQLFEAALSELQWTKRTKNTPFDEKFQQRLPELALRAISKKMSNTVGANTQYCQALEFDIDDAETNEGIIQILSSDGIDTTSVFNQGKSLSADVLRWYLANIHKEEL